MPPPGGVAAELVLDQQQTRVAVPASDEQLVIVADELFGTAAGDLRSAIRTAAGADKERELREFKLDDPALRAFEVVYPLEAVAGEDLLAILGVYLVNRDDTVQFVSFFCNRRGAADSEGCRATARKIARTLRAGPRQLALEAGIRVMQIPTSRVELTVRVPAGFVRALTPGPDYAIYDLRPLAPLGSPRAFARIQVAAETVMLSTVRRVRDYTTAPGKLLGGPVTWRKWFAKDEKVWIKEAIATAVLSPQVGDGKRVSCHIQLRGSEPDLLALETIAQTLALQRRP
jgi:hypothetical protein